MTDMKGYKEAQAIYDRLDPEDAYDLPRRPPFRHEERDDDYDDRECERALQAFENRVYRGYR